MNKHSAYNPENISVYDKINEDNNKSKLLRHILNFAPALVIMSAIIFLTFQPADESGKLSAHAQGWLRLWLGEYFPALLNDMHIMRSGAHIFLYMPLSAALYYAFSHYTSRVKAVFCAVIISSAFGLMDEAVKIFLPGREFDSFDWLIDVAGSFAGALLAFLFSVIFSLIFCHNKAKKFPLTVS